MIDWHRDEDSIIRAGAQHDGKSPCSRYMVGRAGVDRDEWIRNHTEKQQPEKRNNALIWLARGAYYPVNEWLTAPLSERFALQVKALIRRGSNIIIAGEAAAALHGFPLLLRHARIAVAGTGRRPLSSVKGPTSHSRLLHVTGRLEPVDVVKREGRWLTDIPKTAVDLCRARTSENGAVVADAALRGHCTGEELWATFDAYPRSPGNVRARKLLTEATTGAESIGESLVKQAAIAAGVAHPQSKRSPLLQQVAFYDAHGFIGRVDLFVPELGLVIEFDGNVKYGASSGETTQDAISKELAREKRLKNLGLIVVRIVWSQVLRGSAEEIIRRAAEDVRAQMDRGWSVYSGEYEVCEPYFEVEQEAIDLAIQRRKRWAEVGRLY